VIAPGLRVLFCGINPGLYSGATGHHFARPGNRFWPALHRSGFTSTQLSPWQQDELLAAGLGVTNLVARTTATAAELTDAELRQGGELLAAKVRAMKPACLAVLGVGAFRAAFALPKAAVGPQQLQFGATRTWLLPNPSGLNAHYQLDSLTAEFVRVREMFGTVVART
jgi:TDG/mug DNA glycosylase family protein